MNLFHETENKYFEILTYMLGKQKNFSTDDVTKILSERLVGEIDYEVIDAVLSKKIGEESIFSYKEGVFQPILAYEMPIRMTTIEKETFKSVFESHYARHFLSEETIEKGKRITANIEKHWNLDDIEIRNQYREGAFEEEKDYESDLRIISNAIRRNKAILYDNIKIGEYEYIQDVAYPVKIE